MNRQILFLLQVELGLSEFVLVEVADIGRTHLLEHLRTHLLNQPFVDHHVLRNWLS